MADPVPYSETGGVASANPGKRQLQVDGKETNQVFTAVNEARMRAGLTTLERRRDLDFVAYLHALDLIAMGKLSHVSSDGRHLENRLSHLNWVWAGENLARNKGYDSPTEEAVRGWLTSPRHRENMLRPDFNQTGIAVVRDPGSKFYYIAQVFIIPY